MKKKIRDQKKYLEWSKLHTTTYYEKGRERKYKIMKVSPLRNEGEMRIENGSQVRVYQERRFWIIRSRTESCPEEKRNGKFSKIILNKKTMAVIKNALEGNESKCLKWG